MLVRKDLSNDPAVATAQPSKPELSDLHALLDSDSIETHTLLLLFLLPEANHSDVDSETTRAVDMLSVVQDRLSCKPRSEPLERDMLAEVIDSLADIRFGCH